MNTLEELKKYKHIHMLGIGGSSMSGIAEILVNWGFTVTGSDQSDSEAISALKNSGIHIEIGSNIPDLLNADIVVYTAAIKPDNEELVKAKELNIPTYERADFLGILTKFFKDTICISGTHGKSSTTSMISLCFLEACKDPSIQIGAVLKQLGSNYRVGNSDYFIIEACEYVESFLKFFPKTEIILNIDNDHLDYFKNLENIKKAFIKYIKLLPKDGLLVFNLDDINCKDLASYTSAKTITFGINSENADYIAKNIIFNENGFASFDVYKENILLDNIQLSVPGIHNVLNALACIATCLEYSLPLSAIKNALLNFTGAHRRFEFVGTKNGFNIFDDYGHHPTEVEATSKALLNKKFHESWVVFQPHTYSRTKSHLKDFAKSLLNFDHIILTDIYAAREKDNLGVSSLDIVKEINNLGKEAIQISDFEEISKYIINNAKKDDIVLTLGAGTVTKIGPMILKEEV